MRVVSLIAALCHPIQRACYQWKDRKVPLCSHEMVPSIMVTMGAADLVAATQLSKLVGLGQRCRKVLGTEKNGKTDRALLNKKTARNKEHSSKTKIGAHIITFKHFKPWQKHGENLFEHKTPGYFYLYGDCNLDFLEPQFAIFEHEGGVGSYHLTDTC